MKWSIKEESVSFTILVECNFLKLDKTLNRLKTIVSAYHPTCNISIRKGFLGVYKTIVVSGSGATIKVYEAIVRDIERLK